MICLLEWFLSGMCSNVGGQMIRPTKRSHADSATEWFLAKKSKFIENENKTIAIKFRTLYEF